MLTYKKEISLKLGNASCSKARYVSDLKEIDESESDYVLTKTCTLEPIYTKHTYYHFDGIGSVNFVGLENKGFEYYRNLTFKKHYIISVTGSIDEIRKIVSMPTTAHLFEFNVSCPNYLTKLKLSDLKEIDHVIDYGVKLGPLFTKEECYITSLQIEDLAKTTPLRYIVCCNTYSGVIDGKYGGIAGGYLKPISLMNCSYMRRHLHSGIKVIGCGGVFTSQDIEDYIKCGADGVQVATGFMEDSGIFSKLRDESRRKYTCSL